MKALDHRVKCLETKPKLNNDLEGLEATFGNIKHSTVPVGHTKNAISDSVEVRMETIEQTLMKVAEDFE